MKIILCSCNRDGKDSDIFLIYCKLVLNLSVITGVLFPGDGNPYSAYHQYCGGQFAPGEKVQACGNAEDGRSDGLYIGNNAVLCGCNPFLRVGRYEIGDEGAEYYKVQELEASAGIEQFNLDFPVVGSGYGN